MIKTKNKGLLARLKNLIKRLRTVWYDFRCDVSKKLLPKRQRYKKLRKKRAETIFLTVILAYPLLQFAVFYLGVNVNSIFLALKTYDRATGTYYFSGLGNFAKFFNDITSDAVLIRSTKNSLIVYLMGLAVGLPLNLTFAYVLYKKIPLAGFFRVVLFLPSIISTVVMVIMYKYFVEYALVGVLELTGMSPESIPNFLMDNETAFPALIIFGLWSGFGTGLILYMSAMTRIPDSIVEYGRIEGITMFKEFWHIVIPMIFPTITTFLVTGVAGIFINQASAYVFFRENADYNVYTLGYYLFVKVIGNKSSVVEYPYAAAAGITFTLVSAPLTLMVKYLLEKFGPSTEY